MLDKQHCRLAWPSPNIKRNKPYHLLMKASLLDACFVSWRSKITWAPTPYEMGVI